MVGSAGPAHVILVLAHGLLDAFTQFAQGVLEFDLEVVDRVVAAEVFHFLGQFGEVLVDLGLLAGELSGLGRVMEDAGEDAGDADGLACGSCGEPTYTELCGYCRLRAAVTEKREKR